LTKFLSVRYVIMADDRFLLKMLVTYFSISINDALMKSYQTKATFLKD